MVKEDRKVTSPQKLFLSRICISEAAKALDVGDHQLPDHVPKALSSRQQCVSPVCLLMGFSCLESTFS